MSFDFRKIVKDRIQRRIRPWRDLFDRMKLKEVFLAGGGLRRKYRDLDFFPTKSTISKREFASKFENLKEDGLLDTYHVISNTRNALTIEKDKGEVLQFCDYQHDTLTSLVESFDFSHIQLGAKLEFIEPPASIIVEISELYWTDEFRKAQLSESTEFISSDYPMSSLIRLMKYKERGLLPGNFYIFQAIKILYNIANRGFTDYEDFKDQLDAVDIGLLPEDFEDFESEEGQEILLGLFERLKNENH